MLGNRKGNLFAFNDILALAHGCNCAGAMGKGIALEFRRRWPAMFEEYKRRCCTGEFKLGDVFMWQAGDQTIFNLGTQRSWRTKAELWAIDASVRQMTELAEECGIFAVGLPRIGAGLGGLKWQEVEAVLEKIAAQSNVRLIIVAKG